MTLAEDVRNELAQIAPTRRCDALAEISALFHTAGSLHLRGHGELAFHLDVSASSVARRAFSLLRDLGVESEIRTYKQRAFDRSTRYQLHVVGGAATLEVLREAGIVGRGGRPLTRPPVRVVGRLCCRAAYARGALLGAGSVSGPRAAQLEVRFAEPDGAAFLVRIAAQESVPLRARERRSYAVAFAQGAETVADMLALAGASDAALVIDEQAVVGAARAAANRLANADHANLVRTSRAAQEQLRAVRELEERGAFGSLPEELQEIAALRVKHPGLSFRELAAKCEPRVTKAAVQRRLARLVELAGG
jgi:cell division protein WhiA